MSWMKRPQGGTIPTVSEHQAYAAAQPYGNQQNMYPNYQGASGAQQQQMWQMPQQQTQYNQQQYGQVYQQQNYNSANQFYQTPQTQVNQNYTNQNYENVQQGYQQNYFHNQPHPQQSVMPSEGSGEAWEDNWGWGWEDASKQNQKPTQAPSHATPYPQPVDNANIIEESFAPSNTWNWSKGEKKESTEPVFRQQCNQTQPIPPVENQDRQTVQNEPNIESVHHSVASSMADNSSQDVRNLSDREAVKELPNLAVGKRFHLENLTPQWSIESQMSQDSSDGPIHSDSKCRSENPSRNSSKDSPGPTTDSSNFHYSQASYNESGVSNNEWSNNPNEESLMVNSSSNNKRKVSHDELLNSMQGMNLGNHELPLNANTSQNIEGIKNNTQNNPPPSGSHSSISSVSTSSFGEEHIQSHSANVVDAPESVSVNAGLPPIQPASSVVSSALPPPSNLPQSVSPMLPLSNTQQSLSSAPLPPPVGFPPSGSQNPFKHAGSFSHKNNAKLPPSNSSGHSFPLQGVPLSSPSVVNQFLQQDQLSVGYGVNLETTPDNSERPDQPQITGYRNITNTQQLPDNLEIAPQNDRNEYLQTAHLSSGDYGENTDFSRNMPPPSGPRRMGVGQQEVEYGQNLNISGDEPPPGLSRMVPGQQTEIDNIYSQPGEDFMDRQIDGQPTDNTGRPYRQADGQQTPGDYTLASSRANDRRPIGLDRMVPGEPSNEEYNQYQSTNYSGVNEQRVVTGVDRDFSIPVDIGPSNIREQNFDGSDYSEPLPRNTARNLVGAREASNATTPDFNVTLDDQQREVIMEGENLQDLNIICPSETTNANTIDSHKELNNDRADSIEYPQSNSRKHSLNRVTSGDDSERDRNYKASSRKDSEKHKSSRDLDRDKDREKDGRYSRGNRKHDREPGGDRRSGRDERHPENESRDRHRRRDESPERSGRDERHPEKESRDRHRRGRDESPEARRHKRSSRSHRYETEDYYSDLERERRRYREGSYTSSKPPRPEDKERGYENRERSRRYEISDREGRLEGEREGVSRSHRSERRGREKFERQYRDIDPTRKYGTRRAEERKRVVTFCGDTKSASTDDEDGAYSPGSRPGSREATVTDEDGEEPRRRQHERRRTRDRRDQPPPQHYYEGYGADGYAAQRRQYEYYERLRLADPAAYMRLYRHLMDPAYAKYYADAGYAAVPGAGYEVRAEDRASVHSGRSSANGLKHTDTDLTTDMSLNLQLEESTVRSERMTPFKFITSHVKGCVGARSLVVARDGAAGVLVLPLHAALRHDPATAELAAFPGPLVKGVSHKNRVLQYCAARAAAAAEARGAGGAEARGAGGADARGVGGADARGAGGADALGRALVWQLLALLLRQNGVVVGSDIAELLMKNKAEFEYKTATNYTHAETHRGSSASRASRDDVASPPLADHAPVEREAPKPVEEKEALDRLRELLVYGNRQEAIEWAMQCGLWGHALQLASDRRGRAAVAARFVAALPPADPLHTLYHALAARTPPAATCVVDESWGDWRPHAAIVLANTSAKPEQDRRTLVQLGDSLAARGLPYSAQFCYLVAGERPARHPLAPLQAPGAAPAPRPRLSLLLADPRAASLARHASTDAIHATEVYEYALSLSQDFVLHELVVYKLLMSVRLVDAGLCERALGYAEQAARALQLQPRAHSPALAAALAALADRLKYMDPSLQDEAEGGEGEEGSGEGSNDASPRHQQQWLRDVQQLAHALQVEASRHNTPAHRAPEPVPDAAYQWGDQTLQQAAPTFPEPVEEAADYAAQYQLQQQQQLHQLQGEQHQPYPDDWQRPDDTAQTYADPYWTPDPNYQYNEPSAWAGDSAPANITMPGAAPARPAPYNDYDERSNSEPHADKETDTPRAGKETKGGDEARDKDMRDGKGGSGWLGGFLTKLSLRAPNQMILPDDKNPTIVWDEQNKCWRDTNAPADAPARQLPPPPSAAPAPRGTSTPLQSPGAPPGGPPVGPPAGNLFQLQKGRNIKKAYVDVLGANGVTRPAPAPADLPPAPLAAPPAHYFVPPPAPLQSEFYDPTQMSTDGDFRNGI